MPTESMSNEWQQQPAEQVQKLRDSKKLRSALTEPKRLLAILQRFENRAQIEAFYTALSEDEQIVLSEMKLQPEKNYRLLQALLGKSSSGVNTRKYTDDRIGVLLFCLETLNCPSLQKYIKKRLLEDLQSLTEFVKRVSRKVGELEKGSHEHNIERQAQALREGQSSPELDEEQRVLDAQLDEETKRLDNNRELLAALEKQLGLEWVQTLRDFHEGRQRSAQQTQEETAAVLNERRQRRREREERERPTVKHQRNDSIMGGLAMTFASYTQPQHSIVFQGEQSFLMLMFRLSQAIAHLCNGESNISIEEDKIPEELKPFFRDPNPAMLDAFLLVAVSFVTSGAVVNTTTSQQQIIDTLFTQYMMAVNLLSGAREAKRANDSRKTELLRELMPALEQSGFYDCSKVSYGMHQLPAIMGSLYDGYWCRHPSSGAASFFGGGGAHRRSSIVVKVTSTAMEASLEVAAARFKAHESGSAERTSLDTINQSVKGIIMPGLFSSQSQSQPLASNNSGSSNSASTRLSVAAQIARKLRPDTVISIFRVLAYVVHHSVNSHTSHNDSGGSHDTSRPAAR